MFKAKKLLILVFILFTIIYYISSAGKTNYDYFTRLSNAFVQGKLYITENPPWLNELIPIGDKYYIAYPPMPGILGVPFVIAFRSFQQQYLAHLLGAGTAAVFVAISYKIKRDIKLAVWSGLLAGCSTILWFMSSSGSAWYLGQISGAFFMSAAILTALGKKNALFTGIFIGSAYLSRLHTILAVPLFLYLYKGEKSYVDYIKLFIGIAPFVLFDFVYNYSRFGVIWDKGYILIPGVLNEPWYRNGLFSLSYIPNHIKVIFGALPKFMTNPPFIVPSWEGLAVWITTPAFIYSFFNKIREPLVAISWMCIGLIAMVVFSHGTTGFAQFGYRFAVDFYPILLFLTIRSGARGLKWHHWVLLSLGILVNIWGVIWINKFGWVA